MNELYKFNTTVHCTLYSTWWTRLSIFVFSLAGTGCPPANRITERHLLYSTGTLASAFSLAGSGCPPANKITDTDTLASAFSVFFSLAGTGCPPANKITERYYTLASAFSVVFSLAGSGFLSANKITERYLLYLGLSFLCCLLIGWLWIPTSQ